MFFAQYTTNGKDGGGLYYDHSDGPYCDGYSLFSAETFSPDTVINHFIDFHTRGKTYAEKKESVRDAAIDYQSAWSDYCFSYSELDEISDWFYRMGRKYGLLREFRENAIC